MTESQQSGSILNSQAELTVSSPLEAHKHGVLALSLVALDVGYSSPVFAALELDYSNADQDATGDVAKEAETELVYYELDLGLNHVIRKWSDTQRRKRSFRRVLLILSSSDFWIASLRAYSQSQITSAASRRWQPRWVPNREWNGMARLWFWFSIMAPGNSV